MTPLVKPFDLIPFVLSLSKGALRVSGFYLTTVRLVGLELAEGSSSKEAHRRKLITPFVLSSEGRACRRARRF